MATDPEERAAPVRHYNDREIRELLDRATRVPREPAARTGPLPARVRTEGLTLAQLEEIAAEAHIDVDRLRRAARELDAERSAHPEGIVGRLAGAPLRIQVERTLPFEVDADSVSVLVASLGSITGDAGESRLVGRSWSWSASVSSGRRLEIGISLHRGTTRILIQERYGELAGGLFGGVGGGAGVPTGFLLGGMVASKVSAGLLATISLAVAIPATVLGGAYLACRTGFRAYVRRRARAIGSIADRLVRELTALHQPNAD